MKKHVAFMQEWIEHDDIHPLLSHIITYLDPKAVSQFLRCNKQLYYKTILPLIWTQFITTPDTYTPHHLDLWKTLAIDRFRRDTPCKEDEERFDLLLKTEKLSLSLQSDYQNLVTDYQKKCNTYQHLQTLLSTHLDNNQTLDDKQESQLVILYHLHKQYFSCSDQGHFPEKAVSMTQLKLIDQDDLYEDIHTYIEEKLSDKIWAPFDTLEEDPGNTEEKKAAHTRKITDMITENPLLALAEDLDRNTLLHDAAKYGYTAVTKMLIDKNADVNASNIHGETPLKYAVIEEKLDTLNELIAKGADVNTIDVEGLTPLHDTARLEHSEAAKILIYNGADVNARNIQEETPLHLAAEKGNTKTVDILIAFGADVTAKNTFGWTPLKSAQRQNQSEIVKAFKVHSKFKELRKKNQSLRTQAHMMEGP